VASSGLGPDWRRLSIEQGLEYSTGRFATGQGAGNFLNLSRIPYSMSSWRIIACHINRAILIFLLALAGLLQPWSMRPAAAHHLLGKHDLKCDRIFPCPDALKPRVKFWIDVFTKYGDGQVVLHDSDKPDRVYRVLNTRYTCSRKRDARPIARAKKQLRKQLKALAARMEKGQKTFSGDEKHLADMFKGEKPSAVRAAARRIRCQGGVRDQYKAALERHGRYGPMVVNILKKNGLPTDIQYLPFVESSYRPTAYSRVGAAGMWQIMPRTARKLGLHISSAVDERLDPELATAAAARYFLDSRQKLGEKAREFKNRDKYSLYPYVITSYNYGVAGMYRAMDKVGPNYMDVLDKYKARGFQIAVKNFYASFLAARHVAVNADHYFPGIHRASPIRYDVVTLRKPASVERLMTVFGVSEKELREANPSLMRLVWKGRRFVPKGYRLKLPRQAGGRSRQVARLNGLPAEQPRYVEYPYRVKRGDTACGIARREGVSCKELIELNNLGRRALIRVGQILTIPGSPAQVASVRKPAPVSKKKTPARKKVKKEKAEVAATAVSPNPRKPEPVIQPIAEVPESIYGVGDDLLIRMSKSAGKTVYTIVIEPDESMGHYANWLGLRSTTSIRRLNKLRSSSRIAIGKVLKLPIRNKAQRDAFDRQRLDYHRELQDEFRARYRITGVEDYTIKSGDSAWSISHDQEVPLWLLKRFNPKLFTVQPHPGDVIKLPVIEALQRK